MFAIYKKEMRSYFTSPIGYVFIAVFLAISAALFSYSTLQAGENSDYGSYFTLMLFVLVVIIPLLTMKLFSDERKARTEQLLLTAPVTLTGMVLAKFLAAYTIFAGTFLVSGLQFSLLVHYGPTAYSSAVGDYASSLNLAPIFGSLFAMLLVGGAFLAIGLFISSLTENQLIAAIGTIAILMLLLLASFANSFIEWEWLREVLSWISVFSRFSNFTAGIFDFAAVLYYLSIMAAFLFLTVRVFEKRRWE